MTPTTQEQLGTCTRCGGRFPTRTSGMPAGLIYCMSAVSCDRNLEVSRQQAALDRIERDPLDDGDRDGIERDPLDDGDRDGIERDPLDDGDRDGGQLEDADESALSRWAERYEELDGAPENDGDR